MHRFLKHGTLDDQILRTLCQCKRPPNNPSWSARKVLVEFVKARLSGQPNTHMCVSACVGTNEHLAVKIDEVDDRFVFEERPAKETCRHFTT